MIINFSPKWWIGLAIVYCISLISLLDMILIIYQRKSPLFQFVIAFSDIWIFPTPKGVGDIFFWKKKQV